MPPFPSTPNHLMLKVFQHSDECCPAISCRQASKQNIKTNTSWPAANSPKTGEYIPDTPNMPYTSKIATMLPSRSEPSKHLEDCCRSSSPVGDQHTAVGIMHGHGRVLPVCLRGSTLKMH
jgi:hypothetical protein